MSTREKEALFTDARPTMYQGRTDNGDLITPREVSPGDPNLGHSDEDVVVDLGEAVPRRIILTDRVRQAQLVFIIGVFIPLIALIGYFYYGFDTRTRRYTPATKKWGRINLGTLAAWCILIIILAATNK